MASRFQDHQPKDYLAPFFNLDPPQNGSDSGVMSPSVDIQASQSMTAEPLFPAQFDMEMLGNLMSLQGPESPHQISPLSPSQTYFPSDNHPVRPSLMDQQVKRSQLRQLQDLQNQIFQQQISLIINQDSLTHPTTTYVQEQHNYGLPTPISSSELPLEFVSPMALNQSQIPQECHDDSMAPPMPGHALTYLTKDLFRGFSSAPAHVVFRNSPSCSPHSGDLELDGDISPLTSPWFGAEQNRFISSRRHKESRKRPTFSSGDGFPSQPSRKKQSPDTRPYTDGSFLYRNHRGSHSTGSTPLLQSTRFRPGDMVNDEFSGDSPSPVDLSMPPPAAPPSRADLMANMPTANMSSKQVAPVTPASIMNLGRFASRVNPQGDSDGNTSKQLDTDVIWDDATAARTSSSTPTQRNKSSRRSALNPPSPLKPVSPGIGQANDAVPIFQGVWKTTHKDAEQKRRDSLKTTFDDLRRLLPPIPLPCDNKYPLDEPVLPGALPPRGPQKTGSEGPNKVVSKLQLLMYGNDFIRQLKARVERRDEEITRLRQEVGRLRNVIVDTNGGHGYFKEGVDVVDLEVNLDEIEVMDSNSARSAAVAADNEADEEEERTEFLDAIIHVVFS
ncbi:uncharacterized protein EV420DRAFT_1696652 [Desarmillaria tabescens]|uniref:BHLH domain-containing protein n=1 Tax=Armillaria tabescens TaxID=1929756 RepID=A0AA39N129_ARMTA|nr:uncharacterized protein EV420DRAFT_1696652 [Desarmillaria tabescens]KAK0454052.1 hypothetical protein EV420DRAFT_1696652 [Desarmillaria tabescens]